MPLSGDSGSNGHLLSLAREVGKVGQKVDSLQESVGQRLDRVEVKLRDIKSDLSAKVTTGECERRHREYADATDKAMRTIVGSMVEEELTPITEIVEESRAAAQKAAAPKVDILSLIRDNWNVVKVAGKMLLYVMAAVFGLGMLQANQQTGMKEMKEQSKEQKRSILKEVSDLVKEAVKPDPIPAPMTEPVLITPDGGAAPSPRRRPRRSRQPADPAPVPRTRRLPTHRTDPAPGPRVGSSSRSSDESPRVASE